MASESMTEGGPTVWHPGPPAEAIQLAISQQKIFLVWIQKTKSSESSESSGSSETSAWSSLWSDEAVQSLLREHMVSLTLEQSTSDAAMFLQLMTQSVDAVGVWIIFAGKLLLSFTDPPSVEDLRTTLQTTITQVEAFKQFAQAQAQIQTQQQSHASSSPLSSSSPTTQSTIPHNPATTSQTESLQTQLSARRVAQEQRKLAHDRQEKEALRQAAERQASSLDPERQRYITQQAKERALKKEEKRKILERIESDKAERRARAERQHHQQRQQHQESSLQTRPQTQGRDAAGEMTGGGITKVAVRQPDSVILKSEFPSMETLADVRKWIDSNRTDGSTPYVFQ